MGRACTVCEHTSRKAIEKALVDPSSSNRRIAAQYGLAEASVRRHKNDHVPIVLAQGASAVPTQSTQASGAADEPMAPPGVGEPRRQQLPPGTPTAPHLRGLHTRKDVDHADSLVGQVVDLQQQALEVLAEARAGILDADGNLRRDIRDMAAMFQQIRGFLELQAKLLGRLNGPAVTVNVLAAPAAAPVVRALSQLVYALCPAEADTLDAFLADVDEDRDKAKSDPLAWLERRRSTITVEAG